jgi:UDP-N-acetylglucosamine 4,6-dehydratase/5-epimerase
MIKKKSRIAITGACGSIGKSLTKRLLHEGHTVCAFDNNEDGLFKLDQYLKDDFGDRLKLFMGDIRDIDRLVKAFYDVDIVFHCAALKHVYLSEYNPFEVTKTNLIGVNNVIEASLIENVKTVIFTSSDKAVNPTSTMGATKLLGERLFTSANHYAGKKETKFASVRFGNVLNTNGSILQIFKDQLSKNIPLTITSKEMTRFFITMEQAIDLCIRAAQLTIGGEIFIMNMGSCSVINLAKAITKNKKFEYEIIGPKSGEKLFEELVTETEVERTITLDDLNIVIPDTLNMMPNNIVKNYNIKYKGCSKIYQSIRSDINILTWQDTLNLLKENGLVF